MPSMQEKISISINTALLAKADSLIDHKSVKKRSQAFEKILSDYFSSRWHGPAVMLLGKNEKINKSSLIQNIRGLCNLSLKEIIILAGPHKAAVSEYLSQSNLPVPVRYLDEGSLRGTAGALLLAKPYISSDFIVLSDTLFKFDFSRILDFHLKTGSLATIGVTTISMEQSTDSISLDGNRIISFRYNDGKRTYITNAGI